MLKDLHIAGGGVAGLSLGLALARRGLPVTVHEAGTYPRHRICGECLCGAGSEVLEALGLASLVAGQPRLRGSAWFRQGQAVYRPALPGRAIGISRYRLDAALAGAFTHAGGTLLENSRIRKSSTEPGWICATGRVLDKASPWLGLKQHVRGLRLKADLEVHLGRGGYVGVSAVEDGGVNVCGLFRNPQAAAAPASERLSACLRASGLESLAARLEAAEPMAGTVAGVSHFRFGPGGGERASIGDALAITPPFTGNGMSMALEAGWLTAGAFADYALGRTDWAEARARADALLRRRFGRRLRWARGLHPLLTSTPGQRALTVAARSRCLPFGPLYRLTHA